MEPPPLSLNTLGADVTREIVRHLQPATYNRFQLPGHHYTDASQDVVALALTSCALFKIIAPFSSRHLDISADEEEAVPELLYFDDHLKASTHISWLGCVRSLTLLGIRQNSVPGTLTCIKRMPNLRAFAWAGPTPLPPAIATAVLNQPELESLTLQNIESSTVALFSKIAPLVHLSIDFGSSGAGAEPRPIVATFTGCEGTSTSDETGSTIIENLAPILATSRSSLRHLALTDLPQHLNLDKLLAKVWSLSGGIGFPALRILEITQEDEEDHVRPLSASAGYAQLLATSPDLSHVLLAHEGGPLQVPKCRLKNLKVLRIVTQEGLNLARGVRGYTRQNQLFDLNLNGLDPFQIPDVFTAQFDSSRLAFLKLVLMGGAFTRAHLHLILTRCPALRNLYLGAEQWMMEVSYLFKSLIQFVPRLHTLYFDHPWELPREAGPANAPDALTLRSAKHHHFINVRGLSQKLINAEVVSRIHADLAAATGCYHDRFEILARNLPELDDITWGATDEVDWFWMVERVGGGEVVRLEERAEVTLRDDGGVVYGKVG